MRRAATVVALVVGVVVLVEGATLVVAQRRTSASLCGVEVSLRPPVALRVLADRRVPYRVRLEGSDLSVLVPLPAAVDAVRVEDGRVLLDTTLGVTVPAEVELEGGTATITPTLGVLDLDRLALSYDLGTALAVGVTVDSLEVADDAVVVAGRADARQFTPAGRAHHCDPPPR